MRNIAYAFLLGSCVLFVSCSPGEDGEMFNRDDVVRSEVSQDAASTGEELRRDGATSWVKVERLNRRTCPSTACGVVGQLFFREGVRIFDRQDGWVRISEHYYASCVDGKSEFVKFGNSQCVPENGIVDGQYAEWVADEFLTSTVPPNPAADATGYELIVAQSDDFSRYRRAFAKAAEGLISAGRCREKDFREVGGWFKSIARRNEPIYFTFCGGFRSENKLYLDAETGEIFR